MTCADFQKVLPHIIDAGGSAEEQEHLKSCKTCADLVQDLRYIAEQAKLLLPIRDPSPKVWDNIESALEREGLVTTPASSGASKKKSKSLMKAAAGGLSSLFG